MSIKNVVIIGLGLAGAPAAAELAKTLPKSHRVIGLSENDFAYYPIASLRAAVVPGWENKITGTILHKERMNTNLTFPSQHRSKEYSPAGLAMSSWQERARLYWRKIMSFLPRNLKARLA
jgi:flavin-dependent dehydrogenase